MFENTEKSLSYGDFKYSHTFHHDYLILEYPEFNGSVHFFCFRLEILYLANLVQENQIFSLNFIDEF